LQVETFFRSGRPDFVFARATTGFFGVFGWGGIGRGFFFCNRFSYSELIGVRGQESIVDIIPMSLWGEASTIARYEPQTPLNPLKRFVQKSIINS